MQNIDDDDYKIMRDDEIFVNHLQSVQKMFADENDLFSQEFL